MSSQYDPATLDDLERHVRDVLADATAAGALASAHARGRGDPYFADELATCAERTVFNKRLKVGAIVDIGEGELDGCNDSQMLRIGERLGPNRDQTPVVSIAVDPLEATKSAAQRRDGSICVAAATIINEGYLWHGIDGYVDKFIVGEQVGTKLRAWLDDHKKNPLDMPIEETVGLISLFSGKRPEALVAEVLARPRNADLIKRLHRMHVQVSQITDGDVNSAWGVVSHEQKLDFYAGIGLPQKALSVQRWST